MIRAIRTSRLTRWVVILACTCLIQETFAPLAALALTSGPSQPEFGKFSPVGTDGMVNEFTGDFSYSLPVVEIPGPNGFGYALSLSYANTTNVEEEASWVGHGWTLNPGAINRAKRGLPDDYKGETVTRWNKGHRNWTATVRGRAAGEAWSTMSVGASASARYNSHRGYGYTAGINFSLMGVVSIDMEMSNTGSRWGFNYSPASAITAVINRLAEKLATVEGIPSDVAQKASKVLTYNTAAIGRMGSIGSTGGFGSLSLSDYTMSTAVGEYTGHSVMGEVSFQGDPLPNTGIDVAIAGTYATQTPKESRSDRSYGYLYLKDATEPEYRTDFSVEKDGPYQKRDRYLGIPVSNADAFSATGEGLTGSFRLHHRRPGQFKPQSATSTTQFYSLSLDPKAGIDVGFGASSTHSKHVLRVREWAEALTDPDGTELAFGHNPDGEDVFFRFSGDLGGYLRVAPDDDAVQAQVRTTTNKAEGTPEIDYTGSVYESVNQGARPGRAGYIGYRTNYELLDQPPMLCYGTSTNDSARHFSWSGNKKRVDALVNRASVGNGIGEIVISKEDGVTYVYGLPVYSRNEAELQLGLEELHHSEMDGRFLAFRNIDIGESDPELPDIVTGEVRNSPYATTWLLTEIYSPDYIDRTNNGATDDDLGGWVRFDYERTAGTNDKNGSSITTPWYRWRDPYRGLRFEPNSLSSRLDDIGTVSYGQREVYYLESIETRTHRAKFEISPRLDAYPAVGDEGDASSDREATTANVSSNQTMRKLDRIRVYSKGPNGTENKLLRTVNFEYTYELCRGLPNSADDPNTDPVEKAGKLTLKRVFFEHEDVYDIRIRPYEFSYEYHKSENFPASVVSRYSDVTSFADNLSPEAQNRDYSTALIDRWGNYQNDTLKDNVRTRLDRRNVWVDQRPFPTLGPEPSDPEEPIEFDPAAWQLKSIKLPSGAEIIVQYEQKDYRYVQNRPAMVMVPIHSFTDNEFTLNLSDLDLSSIDLDQYPVNTSKEDVVADAIRKLFVVGDELIFFRLLYSLRGDEAQLEKLSSEYISGWAGVESVSADDDNERVTLVLGDDGQATEPKSACRDFWKTNRVGIVSGHGFWTPEGIPDPPAEAKEEEEISPLFHTLHGQTGTHSLVASCSDIDEPNSYLRIPLPVEVAKKGGGIRVKRILVLDRGLESGVNDDAALYGSEYAYVDDRGLSSGVASNEPSIGREENSLVQFLKKRTDQSALNRSFSGKDRDQFEGPIGESLMPGASVGHSRVVVSNLHKGESGTGYAIHEFYTARDYPFNPDAGESTARPDYGTGVDVTTIKGPQSFREPGYNFFSSEEITRVWRSQGYGFRIIDMHGRPRSVARYGGRIEDENPQLVESTKYEYFQPGEQIVAMHGPSIKDTTHIPLGVEMELIPFSRETVDSTDLTDRMLDGGIIPWFIPFPYVSYLTRSSLTKQELKYHVTTKVTRYPVIQKRIIRQVNDVVAITENLAFDPQSGKPVLVRTMDDYDGLTDGVGITEHDGAYYTLTIPAHWYYESLGQRALVERRAFGSEWGSGSYQINKRYGGDDTHSLTVLTKGVDDGLNPVEHLGSGDLVEIQHGEDRLGLYHIGHIVGNQIELLPVGLSRVDDRPVRNDVSIVVVRPGRMNRLTQQAGSLTTYGTPPLATSQ